VQSQLPTQTITGNGKGVDSTRHPNHRREDFVGLGDDSDGLGDGRGVELDDISGDDEDDDGDSDISSAPSNMEDEDD
jgi:hypothetical protein